MSENFTVGTLYYILVVRESDAEQLVMEINGTFYKNRKITMQYAEGTLLKISRENSFIDRSYTDNLSSKRDLSLQTGL